MSEIKKYKKYLNFKANPRYLRRDFIVPLYTGTEPDIAPEASIEQQGTVQEFNDGGRVSFKKGGKVIEKEYLINFMKENSGISHLEKAKKLNKLGFKNSQGGKITDSLLEKFVTQNPELKGLGARSAAFTLDEVKQYARPKQLQDFESGLIDEQTFRTRVNQYRGDLKKTPEQKELYRKINYERMKTDPEKKARVRERQLMYNEKRYLEKGMYPPSKNPKDALWRDLLRSADVDDRVSLVGKRPNKYPRDVFQSIKLKDNETGKIISYKNLEKHPEYNKAIEPYQTKFAINQSELSPETRKKITYQRAEGGNKYNIVIQHNQGLGKNPFNTSLAIQGENIQESLIKNRFQKKFDAAETLSDKKQAINIFKKELEEKAPNIISQPGKKIYGTETNIEDLLKTSKVPIKDRRKILQVIKEKRTQAIANIGCYTLNKSLGGRVNFSEGSNCYAKGLEKIKSGNLTPGERIIAGDFLKEVGADTKLVSSLAKGGKNALRLLQELTVGTGPVGIGVTAALTVPFALADLSEGKRGSETLSNATFGLIGRDEEDILKGIGGPKVSQGLEIENNFKKLEELENQYDNLENQIMSSFSPDDIMSGVQERMAPKMIESEKKRLDEEYNKTLNYLTPFLKKDLSSINPNAPGYKELLEARKLKTEEEKLRTEAGQARAYAFGIDDVVPQEKDGRINPMLEKSSLLEKQLKEQEQKYYENQQNLKTILQPEVSPDDYLNEYRQYMSGGRVKLSEGGKGPKISRRGFLGFLMGAASLPFVGKLMKGKKGVEVAKVAGKVLPKVSGMPEWFSPLVNRIQKEGIDISPKATRVEDIVKVKKLEVTVPGEPKPDIITMSEYPDGRIEISADVYGGSFDSPFDLVYKPPKSDIDLATGKAINEPGDFSVIENRPRPVYSPDDADYEIDYEKMTAEDAVSDLERIEKIATGKRIHPKRVEQREKARAFVEENPYDDIVNRYGDAGDIEYDRMRDEGLLDEIE
jgi:hypothetical protein